MTRTIGRLGLSALGVSVLLGGLWAIGRGQAAAGETDGLVSEEESASAPAPVADLVSIQEPTAPLLEAVAAPDEGDRVAIDSGDVIELGSVSGVVSLPPGFVPTEPVEVFAWPVGEGERTPLSLQLAAPSSERAANEWTFQELPLGPWVFTARAVALDHCAWGKSQELSVLRPDPYDGVEVSMKEFGVRGVLTDTGGSPLAGVEVSYGLDSSDRTVGAIDDWPQSRETVQLDLGSGRMQFSFDGRDLEIVEGLFSSTTAGIEFTSIDGLLGGVAKPSAETAKEIGKEAGRLAIAAALLERRSHQIQLDELTVALAPHPKEFLVGQWGVPSSSGENDDVEEAPSIPSSGAVVTDAAGRFWIALPGPGEVTMTVASTRIQYGDTDPGYLGGSTSEDLTGDAPIGEASLALERAAGLVGCLVRGDGHRNDLNVFLRPASEGATNTASTDAEGRFRFSVKRPGRYIFYARGGGSSGQDYCAAAEIDLTAGSIYVLDDVLTNSSSLTGVVLGADGQPVSGAEVIAFGANNRSLKRVGRTDEWGTFTITGMYPVEYTLEVSGKPLSQGAKFFVPPAGGMANAGTLTLDGAEKSPR